MLIPSVARDRDMCDVIAVLLNVLFELQEMLLSSKVTLH